MTTGQLSGVLQHLRTTALLQDSAGTTDGELLEQFIAHRDEAAFEALVQRHGPMVWGLCRRVLHNLHDAEDAFQATFVVLVRKAAVIGQRELVGNWLYGAAYRAALEAKATARRRAKEKQVSEMPDPEAPTAEVPEGLRPLLDLELNRLPDKYRLPVVLCDLEGLKRREVARQLGIPEGTLSSRLATARRMLAQRLACRGLALSAGALALALSQSAASAQVPKLLVFSTVKAATAVAAGGAATLVVSARVAALAEGVMKTMFLIKLRLGLVMLLAASMIGTIGGLLTYQALAGQPAAKQEGQPKAPAEISKKADAEKLVELQKSKTDQRLAALEWKQRSVLRGHKAEVFSVAFIGKTLLSAGKDERIRIWDPTTGKEFEPEDEKVWKTYPEVWLAALPGGERFAISCITADGTNVNSIGTVSKGVGPGFGFKSELKVRVTAIASDGKTWALIREDEKKPGPLHTIDFDTGKVGKDPKSFEGDHDGKIRAAAFSPDGDTLATASEDKTVKLWDCVAMKERVTCKGHARKDPAAVLQPLVCVAFAPDGKTVAAGSTDGTVRLWDAATGKEVAVFHAHEGTVNCLAFAANGNVLATGGDDKTVAVWDVSVAKRLAVLKGHTGSVRSVAFSRDAALLASGGEDKEIRLWEQAK